MKCILLIPKISTNFPTKISLLIEESEPCLNKKTVKAPPAGIV